MINPMSLAGRRFLVTGASSGIGKACCDEIDLLGGSIILAGRRQQALDIVREGLSRPDAHTTVVSDLSDLSQIPSLMEMSIKGGKLDGVVHAAGVCPVMPTGMIDEKLESETMRINCFAFLEIVKFCAKKKYSKFPFSSVVISSVSAKAGWAGGSVYAASKGAVSASVLSLAVELAKRGMRVNSVMPSNIKTPLFDAVTDVNDEAGMQELLKRQPLGIGQPEQVANAVCFLLSDAASFITGVNLPVDGGYLAQ